MTHVHKIMVVFLLLGLAGCEEEVIQMPAPNALPANGGGATGPAQNPSPPEAESGVQAPEYRDTDFVEAETNRDPFRTFAQLFIARGPEVGVDTRDVLMSDTGIEEMRVIGVITGMANPRAMIVDRGGVGHTVRRGDWIGRNEVVQAGGTEELPVTLNWRVERIRANQVVLTREDPTAPNRPPLTRVLPLRDEAEEAELGAQLQIRDAIRRR
ncbi:MAG: hypothetical protein AB8I08_35265 [Sandaracinaceae bacterium]